MNLYKVGKEFLKNSKVWIIGLIFSMITVQGILCSIEINNIHRYIEDTANKNAESLNSSVSTADIFSLRKVLWIIYDGRTSYVSFQSPVLIEKHFQAVNLGILKPSLFQKIQTLDVIFSGFTVGKITYSIDFFNLFSRVLNSNLKLFFILLIIFSLILLSSNFSIYMAIHGLETSINTIADLKGIEDIEKRESLISKSHGGWFFSFHSIGVNRLLEKISKLLENERKSIQNDAMIDIASQVSHDIRSPLSALNMMMGQLDKVPEQQRVLMRSSIQRINDIANELLQKGKQIKDQEKNLNSDDSSKESKAISSSLPLKVELLAPIIDSLVSEKRSQFREKQGVNIEADVNLGYGLFANINSTELKRTISNLLNNAIEAFPESKGRVVVALRNYSKMACLIVQDNGKGIPEHILAKLGEMGLSHGKEGSQSGSGLGVYHAKKTVESFGGKFDVVSKVGHGTTITMSFPKAQAPSWFVEKLVFKHNSKVISLDDDLSIHQVWKGRFESQNFPSVGIEHLTFTSGNEFKEWLKNKSSATILNLSEECLFLMDYELLNQKATGLDLIEELGIGKQSFLVSSRYEEESIRSRCEKLGVKLIPKAMAGFVPIEIEKPKEFYHALLIDDDILVHMTWGMMAEEKNKKFIGFYKPEDFFNKAQEIDFESPIFVDSNLGNNVRGEDLSLKIHEMGFKNIHLCTGYDPSEFPQMHWIKSICPKDPQF